MDVATLYHARAREGRLTARCRAGGPLAAARAAAGGTGAARQAGAVRAAPSRCGGLYLWGGVGRGKSMLMDLFLEALPEGVPVRSSTSTPSCSGCRRRWSAPAEGAGRRHRAPWRRRWRRGAAPRARRDAGHGHRGRDGARGASSRSSGSGVHAGHHLEPAAGTSTRTGSTGRCSCPSSRSSRSVRGGGAASPTDHRQGRIRGAALLLPGDAEARARHGRHLAGADPGRGRPPIHLRVFGREVEVPRFHNGCARATFFDLCGRPLGPADYLALAEPAACC
jgi:cell division protein ZapE